MTLTYGTKKSEIQEDQADTIYAFGVGSLSLIWNSSSTYLPDGSARHINSLSIG